MDEFVLRVIEQSVPFRALAAAGDRLAAAAAEARAARSVRKRLDQVTRLGLAVRIRCLGWVVLSAAVTHAGLAVLSGQDATPAPFRGLVALIAASGAVAIWLAPQLAAAWRSR